MAIVIQCEQCSTKYRVPKDKVPEGGIKARCKGCGHVITIAPSEAPKEEPTLAPEPVPAPEPAPVPEPQAPPRPPAPSQDEGEPWRCSCGKTNPAALERCQKCKRSRRLFENLVEEPAAQKRQVQRLSREKARPQRTSHWRGLLLAGALAVVLGVAISYALGYAVNRSITTVLGTIFK